MAIPTSSFTSNHDSMIPKAHSLDWNVKSNALMDVFQDLTGHIAKVVAEVTNVAFEVTNVASEVEDVAAEVKNLAAEVKNVAADVTNLKRRFSSMEDQIKNMADRLAVSRLTKERGVGVDSEPSR